MAGDWVEVQVASPMDAGELLGMVDDPAVAGAWDEGGIVHLYWPEGGWNGQVLDALTSLLRRVAPETEPAVTVLKVANQDWNEAWAKTVRPIRIGRRLVIRPSWEPAVLSRGDIELILDPKQAFGTGHHATTRLLLEWLEELIHGGERILDLGTGSGILAMAAVRFGAASALAIDYDPVAIDCAKDYAAQNGFGAELELRTAQVADLREGDAQDVTLVLANLDRKTLLESAPCWGPYLARGARLLLSGLLVDDRAEIASACAAVGGLVRQAREAEGWLALEVLAPETCEGGT